MRLSLVPAAVLSIAGIGLASAHNAPTAAAPEPADRTAPRGEGHANTGTVGQKLETGANSFTEGQVRERFGKMGFGEVKDLKKDEAGIWRGTAQHAGKPVSIGMDLKGNVAAQ